MNGSLPAELKFRENAEDPFLKLKKKNDKKDLFITFLFF